MEQWWHEYSQSNKLILWSQWFILSLFVHQKIQMGFLFYNLKKNKTLPLNSLNI